VPFPDPVAPYFVYGREEGEAPAPEPAAILYAAGPEADLASPRGPLNVSALEVLAAGVPADAAAPAAAANGTVLLRFVRFLERGARGDSPFEEESHAYALQLVEETDDASLLNALYQAWLAPRPPALVGALSWTRADWSAEQFAVGLLVNETISSFNDLAPLFDVVTRAIAACRGGWLVRLLLKDFPTREGEDAFDLSSLAGPFFLTFLLHMPLPVFVSNLVFEREKRLTALMRMMGLRASAWWLANWCFFGVIYVCVVRPLRGQHIRKEEVYVI
jgi:hypothetical protein